MATRHGEKTGIWPFRHGVYTVYRKGSDGSFVEVMTDEFWGAKHALKAARSMLDSTRDME